MTIKQSRSESGRLCCLAGDDRWSSASGQLNKFVNGHSFRTELNSIISVQVCLVQVRYDLWQFSWPWTVSWVVTMDNVPITVAACNLFAWKLNIFCKSYLAFAVNRRCCFCTVAGATGFGGVLAWIQFWRNSYFSFLFSFLSFNFCSYSIFILEIIPNFNSNFR